jgi:hypothetical protein
VRIFWFLLVMIVISYLVLTLEKKNGDTFCIIIGVEHVYTENDYSKILDFNRLEIVRFRAVV